MSLTELERWVEEKGYIKEIPEGKVLRDILRQCIQSGTEIGDSGIHASRSESDLKKIVLRKFNYKQCNYIDSENSRCEEFGMFEKGLCDNHKSYRQCTFVVDPTFKYFTPNSRCRKFGTFEKGRCEDHDGIIQCPINRAHTGSALSLFGQEELTHGAFYEFEYPSTECRKSGNVVYRFCGICSKLMTPEYFRKVKYHPCKKDILHCDARNVLANGRIGTICRSGILTTVDGQELTDGALLKCDSPQCPQIGIRYRYCGRCKDAIRIDFFRTVQRHPCAKEILFCRAIKLGEHTNDHMGSVLIPVDGQELTHGVELKCHSPVCRQRRLPYRIESYIVVDVERLIIPNLDIHVDQFNGYSKNRYS